MSQNVMSITATPDAGRAWRLCQFPALLLSPDDRIIWYIALRRDKENTDNGPGVKLPENLANIT